MIEVFGNAWDYYDNGYILCITTNGFIKKNGCNVMGAGIALEARKKFPGIDKKFGDLIKNNGHIVQPIHDRLLSFPVKDFWYNNASASIIRESSKQLKVLALLHPKLNFILPRPGCGNGKLCWTNVKPLLIDLPDNVHVIHFKEEN